MSSVLLLWNNRADEAVLSSPGQWQAPLRNLQTRILSEVARSVGLRPEDTIVNIDLTRRRPIRGLVLANSNLTTLARYRVRAYRRANRDGLAYETDWRDVYGRIYTWRELRWGDPNFWFGRPSEEDLFGFTRYLIHILPDRVDAQFWEVEVDDPTNEAGYVQFGRLFISNGSVPSHNYSVGASLGLNDDTRVERSRTGVPFFSRREPRRVQKFNLELLPEQEAIERWFEVHRRMGLSGEVFVVPDPENEINITRRSILGTIRSSGSWDQVLHERASVPFEVEESL